MITSVKELDKQTPLDVFTAKHGLKVSYIKVECPQCGNSWGIAIDKYPSYSQIPQARFRCLCGYYKNSTE